MISKIWLRSLKFKVDREPAHKLGG
jgi:hypothetical protein